jgi:hypothetical protein
MRFLIGVGVRNFFGAGAYLAGVDRRRYASDVKPKLRITPVIDASKILQANEICGDAGFNQAEKGNHG